jgi:hypothetical protein
MTLHEHLSPDEVDASFRAVADLLTPERDLSTIDRDDLGTLIRLLCIVRQVLAASA